MVPRFLKILALLSACVLYTSCSSISSKQQSTHEKEEWTTYTNAELGFSVKYPQSWVTEYTTWKDFGKGITLVGFGTPESRSGGMLWGVEVYEKNYSNTPDIETVIKEIGKQFNDRSETREKIYIGPTQALLITVTTQKISDWISKTAIIETPKAIYSISNGAIDDERFEHFYRSFEIL